MNNLVQILSKKHIDATAKKLDDSPRISGTFDSGCAKFGTTPGGAASPGICASACGGNACNAAILGIVRPISHATKQVF
jgi:hypothetical protein